MAGPSNCSIYIGNLDERVSERVLYDILIQAGRVVDLSFPRDKETDRTKGFAFAQYETEEIADYAIKLFSGLVTLYNRTLRFAVSGKDKLPNRSALHISSPQLRASPLPNSHGESSPNAARLSEDQTTGYGQVDSNQYNSHRSRYEGTNFDYSRRNLGATNESSSRSRLNPNNTRYKPY
ncbi:spliceosome-associated protein 49 [Impatiens glandulifera]|uniref:spliceosome-associated protein 49 n=1 Tax=Impatiens glandulifera TaxID=253017 RepID=UPI001FB08349|nr:spliceosome-associated protein 49 [Impatiens glandulifera]